MPFDCLSPETTPAPTIVNPVRDLLQHGLAKIEAGKWCQDRMSDFHGNRCAVGWLTTGKNNKVIVEAASLLSSVALKRFGMPTAMVNDFLGYHAVITIYRLALAELQST